MGLRLAALGPSDVDPHAMLFADRPAIDWLVGELSGLEDGVWTADLIAPPVEPESGLRRLAIQVADGLLRVEVQPATLRIEGSAAHLGAFADLLQLHAEYNDLDEPGAHCHVDRSDADWVAPDSVPLMVAGWIPEPELP